LLTTKEVEPDGRALWETGAILIVFCGQIIMTLTRTKREDNQDLNQQFYFYNTVRSHQLQHDRPVLQLILMSCPIVCS